MDVKDIISVCIEAGLGLIVGVLSYAYTRDNKELKNDIDQLTLKINTFIDAFYKKDQKEIWEFIHRMDKEQTRTKDTVDRCHECQGDNRD